MSKNRLKRKIKKKFENEKSLKNLLILSLHPLKDDLVAYMSLEGTHSASPLHSNTWGWRHH